MNIDRISYGRHLSNIFDHRRPNAEMYMCHDYNDWCNGPAAMEAAWNRHLDWINNNVVDPPKATDVYTVEQLENMSMIGIYAPVEKDDGQDHLIKLIGMLGKFAKN